MSDGRKLTWLAIAFALLSTTLIYTGRPLMTATAPLGIVSFQFAFNAGRAEGVLASWDASARDMAWVNLALDFPYLFVYAAILSLICRMAGAATTSTPRVAKVGALLALWVWLAALCDVIENFALLRQLASGATEAAALLSGIAAAVKFVIIAIALIYLIATRLMAIVLSR